MQQVSIKWKNTCSEICSDILLWKQRGRFKSVQSRQANWSGVSIELYSFQQKVSTYRAPVANFSLQWDSKGLVVLKILDCEDKITADSDVYFDWK